MGIKKAVTDFDNTVTEEKELEPFFEAYSTRFCDELSLGKSQYEDAILIVRNDMTAEPLKYGWKSNKFFSAPVTGDPIGSNTVAHIELLHRIMADNFSHLEAKNVPKNEGALLNLKEKCYLEAYPERKTFFRKEAANYLNSLGEMFPEEAAIMSNSKDTSIQKKIQLLENYVASLPIIGLAQKMNVASEVGQIQPDGFPVPINPDRPDYLNKLRTFHPILDELAVVGDNFFLDIAAVLLNGGYGVLLETEATQGYEIPFLQAHPRGHFAKDYDSALAFIAEHRQ